MLLRNESSESSESSIEKHVFDRGFEYLNRGLELQSSMVASVVHLVCFAVAFRLRAAGGVLEGNQVRRTHLLRGPTFPAEGRVQHPGRSDGRFSCQCSIH